MIKTAIVVTLMMAATAFGAGTEYQPPATEPAKTAKPSKAGDLYAKGKAALVEKDFATAEKFFTEANRLDPKNPDTLNELAFSQRHQGKFDEAFANYGKALKLRPKFAEAREYLGEAHLQAALREIETLKSYGDAGKEELEDLTKALQDAAASVKP